MILPLLAGVLAALAVTLPLAWKWELGMLRVGVAVALLGTLAAVAVALLGIGGVLAALLVAVVAVAAATGLLAWRFYRDPERVAPAQPGAVVSPADGEVLYVRRSEGGVVTLQRHFPGLFGSLKDPENMLRNERATIVIEHQGTEVAMVQIASRLVRQIVSYVREGQPVAVGDRVGVIRLGSQVDVVLPLGDDLEVLVRPGERVRAGESVLATFAVAADASAEGVRESLSAR